MPHTLNTPTTRVVQLMKRIEVEEDRDTLVQLFTEPNLLLDGQEQTVTPTKKTAPLYWLRPTRPRAG